MSTISIHPLDYIKVHSHLNLWTHMNGLNRLLPAVFKSIGEGALRAAPIAMVAFSLLFLVFSLAQSLQAVQIISCYHLAINEVVFIP